MKCQQCLKSELWLIAVVAFYGALAGGVAVFMYLGGGQ